MTEDRHLASLRAVAPFDRLPHGELALLLQFADVRQHSPGAIVHRGVTAPARLHVVLAGAVVDTAGAPAGPVLGLAAMFALPSPDPLAAHGTLGVTLLSIDRQTFFTLARAYPQLVRGFLEVGPAGLVVASERSPMPVVQ